MKIGHLFDVGKPQDVDLSHLVGLTDLVNDYDVIESVEYTHHTKIKSDVDNMELLYFDIDDEGNEGVLIESDGQTFFFKLVHSAILEDQEEYDDAIFQLEQETLPFSNEKESHEFRSLSKVWELNHGSETVLASSEPENDGVKLDILYRFFMTDNEYMFASIVEGELSLYVGVQITEGKLL